MRNDRSKFAAFGGFESFHQFDLQMNCAQTFVESLLDDTPIGIVELRINHQSQTKIVE
jgi:hypothetical protein